MQQRNFRSVIYAFFYQDLFQDLSARTGTNWIIKKVYYMHIIINTQNNNIYATDSIAMWLIWKFKVSVFCFYKLI